MSALGISRIRGARIVLAVLALALLYVSWIARAGISLEVRNETDRPIRNVVVWVRGDAEFVSHVMERGEGESIVLHAAADTDIWFAYQQEGRQVTGASNDYVSAGSCGGGQVALLEGNHAKFVFHSNGIVEWLRPMILRGAFLRGCAGGVSLMVLVILGWSAIAAQRATPIADRRET